MEGGGDGGRGGTYYHSASSFLIFLSAIATKMTLNFCPTVANLPEHLGKWYPAMINNPNYKGKWKPAKIPNPDYFRDDEPFKMAPIGNCGVVKTQGLKISHTRIYILNGTKCFKNFCLFLENSFILFLRESRGYSEAVFPINIHLIRIRPKI